MKVAYELLAEDGHFVCHAPDGSEIRVEAGKPFSTDDPAVMRELDAQAGAVQRVKPKKAED